MRKRNPNQHIKDYIIEGMVEYPRTLIENIITFQGESMLEASRKYSEIEISGFGILYVAKGKLSRELAKAEKALITCKGKLENSITEEDMIKNQKKVDDFTNKVAFLKSKQRI